MNTTIYASLLVPAVLSGKDKFIKIVMLLVSIFAGALASHLLNEDYSSTEYRYYVVTFFCGMLAALPAYMHMWMSITFPDWDHIFKQSGIFGTIWYIVVHATICIVGGGLGASLLIPQFELHSRIMSMFAGGFFGFFPFLLTLIVSFPI